MKILLPLTLILLIICLNFFGNKVNLTTSINYFIDKKESTFINIAAIFIGVYFALFSLFTTVKRDSTIASLSEDNFRMLLGYIRNALIGSFIYIFLTLFFSPDNSGLIWDNFNIVLFVSLIYMLASALRFGGYIMIVVYKDLSNVYPSIEEEEKAALKQKEIMIKLETFLNEYEKMNRKARTDIIRNTLKDRNGSQDIEK